MVLSLTVAGCSVLDPPDQPAPSDTAPSAPVEQPPTLRDSVAFVSSGVVRIEVTTCEPGLPPSGSGFLVDEDLVATVAHVVEGARTIALRTSDEVIRGEVVGVDPDREVALVRAVRPLGGSILVFATESPEVTDEVAVLGYPLGQPLATNVGAVSGLDRRVEFESQSLSGLIQTDASVNPGNSGGPMINAAGEVVGLVEAKTGEGLAYAVPAGVAGDLVEGWAAAPVVEPPADCPDPTADLVTIESKHADAPALARTFHAFIEGINLGYYEDSWALLTGRRRAAYSDFESFVEAQSTSTITDFVLEKASMKDETSDTADVRFTSRQAAELGPDGQTCSQWHLRYTMRMDSGYWRIDGAENLEASPVECAE
jgi:hypothetical protein